jgi:hypothetical protein
MGLEPKIPVFERAKILCLWPRGHYDPHHSFLPVAIALEIERQERKAGNYSSSNTGFKNSWSYTLRLLHVFTAWCFIKQRDKTWKHCIKWKDDFKLWIGKNVECRGIFYGSNPAYFNLPNPSIRNMALGSTEPLTGMNTLNIPGV